MINIAECPRSLTYDELHRTGLYLMDHVAPNRAMHMILELSMFPFEDMRSKVMDEANQLYAQSFR